MTHGAERDVMTELSIILNLIARYKKIILESALVFLHTVIQIFFGYSLIKPGVVSNEICFLYPKKNKIHLKKK